MCLIMRHAQFQPANAIKLEMYVLCKYVKQYILGERQSNLSAMGHCPPSEH